MSEHGQPYKSSGSFCPGRMLTLQSGEGCRPNGCVFEIAASGRDGYDDGMNIEGLTAIVTGATGRLGRAFALGLAGRGMDCICHFHRDSKTAEEVVAQITAMGRRAAAIQADLGSEKEVEQLLAAAGAFGKVRVLVNSAAVFGRCPLDELTGPAVQRMLDVNLVGPMLASRYFVQLLEAEGLDLENAGRPFAKIITMADVGAIKPWAEYAAYCASKAGLIGLTKALAKELAPGATVNAIAPGIITRPEPMDDADEQKQLARIPAGRFGHPEDVVRAVLFLLENDYITGQVIGIDGGRTA